MSTINPQDIPSPCPYLDGKIKIGRKVRELQGLPDQNNGTIGLTGDRLGNVTLNHLF